MSHFVHLYGRWVPFVLFGVALIGLPAIMDDYWMTIAVLVLLTMGFSSAWNISGGIVGVFSFAHVVFFGMGALVSAVLLENYGVSPWISMFITAVASAVLGVGLAWMVTKFDLGVLHFALVTLAFAEMALIAVTGTRYLGGAAGIGLSSDREGFWYMRFGNDFAFYALVSIITFLTVLITQGIRISRFGYIWRAIRDNDLAASGVGHSILKHRAAAVALSAAICPVFGVLHAQFFRYVDPYRAVGPLFMIEVVLFVTIGGIGTVWGPAVGVALMLPLGEILRAELGGGAAGAHYVVFGVLIVFVVRLMPEGIVGGLNAFAVKRFGRPSGEALSLSNRTRRIGRWRA